MTYSPQSMLQDLLRMKQPQKVLLVGIDGPGGTGKTSLATTLQRHEPSLAIVHMDHFDLPSNGMEIGDPVKKEIGEDTDWRRLRDEVLTPLREGKEGRFRIYNRDEARWEEEVTVFPKGIIIVEGVFAIRRELFPFYDFTVWLDCPLSVRLQRALLRDGEAMRSRFENDWLPMEERYIKAHKPQAYAHMIITDSYKKAFTT